MPKKTSESKNMLYNPSIRKYYENLIMSFRKEIFLDLCQLNVYSENKFNFTIPGIREFITKHLFYYLFREYFYFRSSDPLFYKISRILNVEKEFLEPMCSNLQENLTILSRPVALYLYRNSHGSKGHLKCLSAYVRYYQYMDLGIYIHKVKKDDFETAMKYNHIAISLENEYQKYCRRKLEHYGCFYEKLDNLLSDKPVISPRIPLDLNPEPYFIYFHKLDNFRDRYLSELKEYSKEYLGNHKYRQITEKTSKFCVLGELPENKFLDNSDDDIKYIGKLRYLKEDLSSNKLLLSHALCQRYCIMCGRKFFSTKKALFCSYECRSQYHLRKKKYESNIRICPICGKPITGRKDKRTCSNACRTALSRKKRKIS